MIFVTVGSVQPFDRLIEAVDAWAGGCSIEKIDVLAQTSAGSYRPRHCRSVCELNPTEYREAFQQADFVVSHAGMGTIITALELEKPLVVMPRLGKLNETRNDHQLATVRHFRRSSLISVAETREELNARLNEQIAPHHQNGSIRSEVEQFTQASLVQYIRDFVSCPP